MPTRIVIIAEADIDRRHVCDLIDRKIVHHAPDWFDAQQLDQERVWSGIEPGTKFTRWRQLKSIKVSSSALRIGGFIGFKTDGPVRFDYAAARKALLLCALATPQADAVVLMRDLDDRPTDRIASINRAAADMGAARFNIILGLPIIKREAWTLNGFVAESTYEKRKVTKLRTELGFDPCFKAERLDAMAHGAKRDVKRVLNELTGGVAIREAQCWQQTEWKVLRERGKATGLDAFLSAVRDKLVPLVTGQRTGRSRKHRK